MAESTELREQVAAPPKATQAVEKPRGVWAKITLVIRQAFFWSYERGSWQYDVIVAAILAFIFLTPRAWLRHETSLGMVDLRHARLLQSRSPETPEAAAQDVLQDRLGKRYRVLSVEAVRDQAGVILSYKVVVEQ
jgi:hypothetical protein